MWLARNEQGSLYHHGPLRREDGVCHIGRFTPLFKASAQHPALSQALAASDCQSFFSLHRRSVLENCFISLYIVLTPGVKSITVPCRNLSFDKASDENSDAIRMKPSAIEGKGISITYGLANSVPRSPQLLLLYKLNIAKRNPSQLP